MLANFHFEIPTTKTDVYFSVFSRLKGFSREQPTPLVIQYLKAIVSRPRYGVTRNSVTGFFIFIFIFSETRFLQTIERDKNLTEIVPSLMK